MRVRIMLSCVSFFVLLGCTTSQVRTAEVPNLKLSFIIDKQYDEENIIGMFRSYDPAGLESRAMSMGIDIGIARKIRDAANPSEVEELVGKMVENRFKKDGTAIEASKEDIEVQWKDLLPLFSSVVVETTESPWVHPEYVCVVSSFHPGLSSWPSGNRAAVKFDSSPESKRRILAHEILLSDVFQLLRKRYNSSEISDWQVWAFSEITPVLILDDPRLQPFWPNFPHAGGYFSHSNYPQLSGLEKQLKELFDHRTSYADYEEKAAPVLRGFQPFIAKGGTQNGWLGAFFGDLQDERFARQFVDDMQLTGVRGAFILGLYKGSPADNAGLMAGDYVTAVGSTQIEVASQLTQVIGSLAAGTKTSMTELRLGQQKKLSVTIGEPDARDTVVQAKNLWPGFSVTNITDEIRKGAGSPGNVRGVVVASMTGEKSPAAFAGFKLGDIITAVNGIKVETLMDFYRALNANGGRGATFAITREGNEITLGL